MHVNMPIFLIDLGKFSYLLFANENEFHSVINFDAAAKKPLSRKSVSAWDDIRCDIVKGPTTKVTPVEIIFSSTFFTLWRRRVSASYIVRKVNIAHLTMCFQWGGTID